VKTARMMGPSWHQRQGYETCECGRKTCRKRRKAERRRERRIEAHELRKELAHG